MTILTKQFWMRGGVVLAAVAALAACGGEKKPVVSAPAPKPVQVPPKPYPPNQASANLVIPAVGADGLYRSVNRGISPAQMTWNLRSAYNVAALNCNAPQHAAITPAYRNFLRAHVRTLSAVNRTVDAEFRAKHGARYIPPREAYMTEVYNHFAFPPTKTDFCDAMLAVSRDAAAVKSADLQAFAVRSLPNIEIVFDDFYRRYDRYKSDLAAWERQYGHYYAPTSTTGRAQ